MFPSPVRVLLQHAINNAGFSVTLPTWQDHHFPDQTARQSFPGLVHLVF